MDRSGTAFKRNGVLIDDQPERPSDVIDAPKQPAIPRQVASPQSPTPFHQPTPQYSINNSRSTPSNTETHASKNPTPLSNHTKTESQKIEFENLFSNLSLPYFKTVADPFSFQRIDSKEKQQQEQNAPNPNNYKPKGQQVAIRWVAHFCFGN